MGVRSQNDRAQVFAALGDPLRLDIVDELVLSDRTPGELIQKFEIPSALLAHHLDVLENAEIVERIESSADRRKRFIRLTERNLPLLVASKYPKIFNLFVVTTLLALNWLLQFGKACGNGSKQCGY